MKHWQLTVKEKGNDSLLHPSYIGNVDEEYLVKFFGLDKPDVEWYKIEEVKHDRERLSNEALPHP